MTTLEDWWFLPKLDIFFPYNPAIVLLAIYPESKAMSKQAAHDTYKDFRNNGQNLEAIKMSFSK